MLQARPFIYLVYNLVSNIIKNYTLLFTEVFENLNLRNEIIAIAL